MKKPLLRQLIMLSKRILYAFSLQLIFCSILLANTGNAQRKSIDQVYVSFKSEELTLNQFMKQIEKQTDFRFTFNPNLVPLQQTLDVEIKNGTVYQVLESLIRQTNLSFVQVNDNIHVKPLGSNERPISIQEIEFKEITGTVKDPTGEPLPGVTILVQGTTTGTVSDADGRFKINASEGDVLVFSFIGYQSQNIVIGSSSLLDIIMREDAKVLGEVVVVGYGSQELKNLTGSISSVNMKELNSVPLLNAAQALQGRAAGVSVTQATGAPGAPFVVQIRGVGSLGNTEPLFVIDGVIGAGGANNINPNDIESIEILKDASSAAIYGSRAANGVVLITTKRGKSGKPQVNFNSYVGLQEVWKKLDVLNAKQYAEYANEQQSNGGQAPIPNLRDPSALKDVTDWQDAIFRTAPIQEYNLSISGGTDNTKYLISGGYMDQQGIVESTGFKRYSFRANTDFNLGKITIGESFQMGYTSTQGDENFAMMNSLFMPTYIPIYNPNNLGGFDGPNVADGMDAKNPLRILELTDITRNAVSLIGNAYINYEIIPGLNMKFSGSIDYGMNRNYNYTPVYFAGERDVNNFTTLSENALERNSPLWEGTIDYRKSIKSHNFSFLAGYTRQSFHSRSLGVNTRNFPNTTIRVLSAANEVTSATGQEQTWALESFLSRVTYDYKGKYLFTGVVRQDGSSRFAEGNRTGVFPSLSLGWRISDESFMESLGFINDLKLKYGWGQLGMQEIGLYPYLATLTGTIRYIFGENQQPVPAITQRALANRDISWETTTQSNFGLDATLFNNSVNLSFDYWLRDTDDMLLQVPVAASSGISVAPTLNAGSVRNRGIDLSLGYQLNRSQFNFGINGNFGLLLENVVTSLGARTQPLFGAESLNRSVVGQSIGHFFGHRFDRIYQTQAEIDADNEMARSKGFNVYQTANTKPGDIRFKDLNGDGVVNALDREVIGNPIPKFNFGSTLNFGYKNFELSMMIQGMSGFEAYNKDRARILESMTRAFNTTTSVLERWTTNNPSTTMPRAVAGDPNGNARFSDRWMEDGSFVRLKIATLAYSIPTTALNKAFNNSISSVRVYVTGQNLLTFTNFSAWDPEFTSRQSSFNNMYRGVAESIYPQARTYLLGVQVGF
ncbi:TonB-dependent receptor [Algoriphagus sp. AK58]|uniref:TonB-dependent receptor n=1 Tax=Algoriphagus sp. AK58 TaxID=1406877 RepID=UPI0016504822|nr:TonB-dependent receptor [Algoriphagus sp. AK58]MBC6366171.1 TonB-dependent receptor [Algoriphagus sp. AK58]